MATEKGTQRFASFKDFYPYYLSEHQNAVCRRLHFIGSAVVLLLLVYALCSLNWLALLGLPAVGYGFAWAGHFFYEKNRPATFKYPLYSLLGDWRMFKDILTGKISI